MSLEDNLMFNWLKPKSGVIEGVNAHVDARNSVDESRREFLKGVGGLAAGAMLGSAGMMVAKDAEASWKDSLPPGIARSSKAIQYIFDELKKKPFTKENYIYVERLFNGRPYADGIMVTKNDWVNEPAVYLCQAMWYNTPYATGDEAMKNSKMYNSSNDPMVFWAQGIGNYFYRWVGKSYMADKIMRKKIEEPFLRAIFYSANPQIAEDRVSQYFNPQINKEQLLQNVIENLSSKNHREQLIAAWSSFFLTDNSYRIEKKGKTTMLYYNELEQKTKLLIGHPIRGPPHYNL